MAFKSLSITWGPFTFVPLVSGQRVRGWSASALVCSTCHTVATRNSDFQLTQALVRDRIFFFMQVTVYTGLQLITFLIKC